MPALADKLECTRDEAVRRVGISERQLRAWEKSGLIPPASSYGIHQLVALRTLARLRAARVPTRKIHSAVDALRRHLRGVRDPFTELRIYSDGPRVRVEVGGVKMEPESGQLLLDFDRTEIRRLVALPSRREAEEVAEHRKKQRQAEMWFQKGVELEQAGAAIDQAIDAYRLALALDPEFAAALVNLGTIFFSARQWDKAEKQYRRALAANPNYALAHFNMGNLYDERGDRVSALDHYRRAIEIEPDYGDAHYNLALLYQVTGQSMNAMRHWRTYLKLDPIGPWAEIARRELDKLYASAIVYSGDARREKARVARATFGDSRPDAV